MFGQQKVPLDPIQNEADMEPPTLTCLTHCQENDKQCFNECRQQCLGSIVMIETNTGAKVDRALKPDKEPLKRIRSEAVKVA
jgi:hypothetical protein